MAAPTVKQLAAKFEPDRKEEQKAAAAPPPPEPAEQKSCNYVNKGLQRCGLACVGERCARHKKSKGFVACDRCGRPWPIREQCISDTTCTRCVCAAAKAAQKLKKGKGYVADT